MPNRFEGRLDRNHGVKLLGFQYNGIKYMVKASQHSLDRFKDHGINYEDSITGIIALGKVRLDYYANKQTDLIIIDKIARISTVLTFESDNSNGEKYCEIRISTIIPRTNVFIKNGTKIFCLKN